MHRAIAVIKYRCAARCGVFPVNFGKMKRDSPVKERHVLVTHKRQNVDIEHYRALFSAEHRRPFLGKGLFRFPVVFGEPEVDEGIGGEVVGFFGRAAGGLVDDAFGAPEGQRGGFVETFDKLHRGADHILVGRDLVDETQAIGFFGAEALAGRHHLHGAAEPDVADKAFVAFPSGDDAEADLRHADLRMGGGNAKVGRKQDFRAPADGETVDRRDDRDVQRLEAAEHRAREAHDLTELVLGLQRRIAFDVAAGAKEPFPGPGNDDGAQAVVAFDLVQDVEKSLGDFAAERVTCLRPVDGENERVAAALLLENLSQSLLPRSRRRLVARRSASGGRRRSLRGAQSR